MVNSSDVMARDADGRLLLGSQAVGLSLSDVNVALGLFYAKPGAVDAAGLSLRGVSWMALSAQAASVEVLGLPLSLSADLINVQVNRVNGLANGLSPDSHVIDFYRPSSDSANATNLNAYKVRAGANSTLSLSMDGSLGVLLRVQAQVAASVSDFLSLSGGISIEQYRKDLTLTDGLDEVQTVTVQGSSRLSPTVLAGYAANYGLAVSVSLAAGGATKTYTTVDLNKNASAATVQTALNEALGGSAAALVSQSA
ncbi:MAG: hypothetical protein EBY28_26725, partial [Betaproteobacteria bacterium]|nr:hypothetical protein [Betaproteobacteria bacterium]